MRDTTINILHLEDSPVDAELVRSWLERDESLQPMALRRVGDRAGFAEAIAGAEHFDLILADYALPDFDGLEGLKLARQHRPQTPFVFVSGRLGEDVAVETLQQGAIDYVLKSRLERLLPAVHRALQISQEREARRRVESALRGAETRLNRLIEDIGDYAIVTLDSVGLIASWNLGARKIFGYEESEVIGRHFEMLFDSDDQAARVPEHELQQARSTGRASDERWMVRKDGLGFFASGVLSAVADGPTVLGFTKIVRDETERRHSQEEREALLRSEQRARAEAEAANRAKDEFLAVLSHELRTPLSPILATIGLLTQAQSADELPPHLRESLEIIKRNAELEARLIDDLLDLTRITRGKLQLNSEAADLHVLIKNMLEICGSDLQAKRLQLLLSLRASRTTVQGDAARLQQVLWNLLKNAVKFTPPGGSITIETSDLPDGQIRVSVIDTGIGIAVDALPRIFAAFEQADHSIVRRFGGLGLGLAIARAITQMHHGTIAAHSDGVGRGARFELTLPTIAKPAAAARRLPAQTPNGKGLRLLLVEDHPDTARVMELLLKKLGHHVSVARDVAGAVERLRDHPFDLLISDIGLPDGTGLDVIRAVPEPKIPSIALTGFGMDHDIARCKAAGFREHITKPVHIDKLAAAIRSLTPGAGAAVHA